MPRRTRMTFRRHVPPGHVSTLKNFVSDLMTVAAIVPRAPAVPDQPAIHRDALRSGKSERPLRSAARLRATTTPTLRPEHKLNAVLDTAPGRRRTLSHVCRAVDGDPLRLHSHGRLAHRTRYVVGPWVWHSSSSPFHPPIYLWRSLGCALLPKVLPTSPPTNIRH